MMLYAFHQGAYKGGQLFYSVFDGTKWQPDTQVQNVGGMGASPAAVVWNGNPHVFHQGGDSDVLIPEPNGELWYAYFDGTNWYDIQVQNVGMSESPSAVAYGGNLYVFHQGGYENGELYYSVFDGANWHPDTQVPNVGMSESPSAVVWNGDLHVFHQGGYQNGDLLFAYFDGTNWHPDTLVQNVGMSGAPSGLALSPVTGTTLFAPSVAQVGTVSAIAATNADGSLWYLWQQIGSSQWNAEQVSGPGTIAGAAPSVAAVGKGSAIAAIHADGSLWYYWQPIGSSQWNPEEVAAPPGT